MPDRKRTATREILGTASLSSSSRFPPSSRVRSVRPVTLPPGRARLATRPASTGSTAGHHNDGNRLGRILGRLDRSSPSCDHDDIDFKTHQVGNKLGNPLDLPIAVSVLDRRCFALLHSRARAEPSEMLRLGSITRAASPDRYHTRRPSSAAARSANEAVDKTKLANIETRHFNFTASSSILS